MEQTVSWPGWETVRLIGRGSFGAVYEIQRTLFDEVEKAALKVISIPQNASDIDEMYSEGYDVESITSTFQSHLKSIVAEYSLMRKMNGSSNIVNCDDVRYVQHDDGIGWDIFIKMELLTPLVKALPAQIPEEQVIRIAKDMCAALELCSEYNIVHRDIKPQNIFVSKHGDYKLGDFGIAKTVEKTMGGTKTGTYKYMAPEVYSNKPYNSTADIYSLGLVLYWMLNERRMPFMPLSPEKLRAGIDEESRNRRFSGEKIPAPKNGSDELKRIVLKACAFNHEDRYQSSAELLSDLNGLGGAPIAVIPLTNKMGEDQLTPGVDPVEEDATVGPKFTEVPTAEDTEETVVPAFNPVVTGELEDQEKTVGPVFVAKEEPKRSKKKKKIWPIIVTVLICVALGGLYTLSRPTVVGVTPSYEYLENNLLGGYSAIGCYEVSTMLQVGSTCKVNFEVGEAYNGDVVLVTSDNGKVPITTTVVDGMVSVHLNPTDTYMLQVATATDSTNESDWSEWDTELPEGVSLNSNVVQVDIMYRTRQKEFKTYNRETLDGWNLYETFENEQPYGVWSDWTETMLTGDENLEVAEQKQYRYRIKEFTSSQYSTMAGWTQNGVENKYEYGEWSAWRDAQIVASATTEVETKKTYNYVVNCYEDGQFLGQEYLPYQFDPGVPVGGVLDEGDGGDGHYYTFIVDSITITEQYRSRTKTVVSTTYNYYRWTDWSEWNEEEVVASDTCEVEDRVLFRSREIYGDTAYRFWKWSDWSDWTLEKPSEGEDAEVESCVVYRYIP